MSKYYRLRATSMETYYGFIDSEDHLDVFDDEGNPIESNPDDFDLYHSTFPYGIQPVEKDWEFTNYDEISREEYVNGYTHQESLDANGIPREPNPNDTPELREEIAENMIERMTMEDLMDNYKYYLNKDWDSNWGMYEQDYINYLNTEE